MLRKFYLKSLLLAALCAVAGTRTSAQVSGYGFLQTSGTYVPVSSSGTTVARAYNPATTFDTDGWLVSLPFTFQFNGAGYSSIYVNSNGGATFGATTSTSSSLLSGTGAYNGALAIMNRDLWAVMVADATKTSGSATLTGVTSFAGLDVGDTLTGTGIPTNATVASFNQGAGTITLSAAATSAGTGSVRWSAGYVVTETIGSAPNRTVVIEWKNFSDYNTSTNNTAFDFQIRLEETSNTIRYVYGAYTTSSTSSRTNQVGLRGTSNSDYNNRTATLTAGFGATTAGTSNSATVARDNASYPASGLTFTWTPPSCFAPATVTASAVSTTTATISWTAASPAPSTGYQYEVRSSGAAGSGATGLVASGSTAASVLTANVTGLTANTAYSIYVRSNCGSSGFSTWSAAGTFTTLCNALPVPFSQSFDNGTLPSCWSTSNPSNNTSANSFWKFSGSPDYGATSTLNGRTSGTYAWVDASSPYVTDVTLSSPLINLTGLTTPYLQFDWFKNNTDPAAPKLNNNLKVEGNNGSGWVTLFNDTSNAAVWRTVSITLPAAFVNTTAQFRFVVDKTLSNNFYDDLGLDSMRITQAPTCLTPAGIAVSNVQPAGATLSWTAPAPAPSSGYQYEVRSSGAAGSGATGLAASGSTAAGVTTANVTGLTANTSYSVYVRSNCGTNGFSAWSTPAVTFTTPCTPVTTFPYTDTFQTSGLPGCWSASATGAASYYWEGVSADASHGVSGPLASAGFLRLNVYNAQTSYNPYTVTSRSFTLSSPTKQVRYYYYLGNDGYKGTTGGSGSDPYPLVLLASSNGGTTWDTLYKHTSTNSTFATSAATSFWTPNIVNLSAYNGQTVTFRFISMSNYGSGFCNQALDEFMVMDVPACAVPTAVSASSITNTSATISWTAPSPAPASGYQYEVRSSGAAGSGSTGLVASGSTAAGATTANITGLSGATAYSVYVRGNCGTNGFSAWSAAGTFTSLCNPVTSYPWNEGFESLTTVGSSNFPACWTKQNGDWATNNTAGTYTSARTGTNFLTDAWTATNEWIWTPGMQLTAGTSYDFSFWYRGDGYSTWVADAGVNTTANSTGATIIGSSFITSGTTTLTTYQNVTRSFTPTTTGTYYFGIRVNEPNGAPYYLSFDDFSVSLTPSCVAPTAATVTNVTNATATLSWTAPSPAPTSGYQYEVRSTGAAGSGATGLAASGSTAAGVTTANVSGLAATTTYSVYVRSNCGSTTGFSAWSPAATFTTTCNAVASFPYVEDFNAGTLPSCWTTALVSGTTNWGVVTGSSTDISAPKSGAGFIVKGYSTSTANLITPPFNLASFGANAARINFWMYRHASTVTADSIRFLINTSTSTTGATTLTNIKVKTTEAPVVSGSGWYNYTANIPVSFNTAGTVYVIMQGVTTGGFSSYDLGIDSFRLEQAITCAQPTAPTATGVTATSANLGWTQPAPGNPAQWQVSYGTGTVTPASGTKVIATSNPYSLTGLTTATSYTFYVRAICAVGDTSAWSPAGTFTTVCAPPAINLGNDTTLCAGSSVTLSGGTAVAASYQWTLQGSATVLATTATYTTSTPGSYVLQASTTNATCFKRDTIVVTGAALPIVNLGNDTAICAGSSVTFNAGNTGASYLWSTGATTQTISASTAGSYNVRVTSNAGCIGRDTVILSVNPTPSVNLGNDTAICAGNTKTLNAGNAGASYLWSTGATSQTINVGATGSYSVRVTNTSGCVGRDTVVVTVNPNPVVNLGPDTTFCLGGSVVLNAGNTGSTFLWNNGSSTQSIQVNSTGTYSVRVTNTSGCIGRDTVVVTVNPIPVVNLGKDTALCSGNTLVLNAGNTGSSFAWSTGATTQTINVDSAGTYSVTVSNAFACVGRDTVVVTVNPTPSVNLGNDTAFCAGNTITLNAGNAGASYLWNTGATTQTITAGGSVAGTYPYSVRVTNASGCSKSDTLVLTLNPAPIVKLGNDTTFCAPNTKVLTAGTTGSFLWNTGATTPSITVGGSGTYSVRVTTGSGCEGRDTIVVTVIPQPVAGVVSVTDRGGNARSFKVTGSQNATQYIWYFGDSTAPVPTTADTILHTFANSGVYTVRLAARAANGCGADTIRLTVRIGTLSVGSGTSISGDVQLFPNPATSNVVVEATGTQLQAITVVNAVGAVVLENEHPDTLRQTLDVSNLASGSYLVRIRLKEGTVVRRLQVVK